MKKIVIIFSILSIFTSCTIIEKEIDLLPIDHLTQGGFKIWQLKSLTINGIDQISDCFGDDTFIFDKKEGSYDWKKGDILCNDADSDVKFTFSLSNDGTTLTINEFVFKVNKLSMKTLEIEITLNEHIQIWTYSAFE